MTSTTTCESCGRDEPSNRLGTVHRVYLTPGSWDTEEKVEVVESTEVWCLSCQSTYPHQLVEGQTAS